MAALVERADSALPRTDAALVGLGRGVMGRMVMSLDFRPEAKPSLRAISKAETCKDENGLEWSTLLTKELR